MERGDNEIGSESESGTIIAPGKGRGNQLRRVEARKLFDDDMKDAFLAALSCSANVVMAAGEVGVDESTVYRHRRSDPEFRAGFWAALEAGCAKLAALRLQREIARAEAAADGSAAAGMEGLDGPPDARQIADLVKLMQALRDLTRNLSGEPKPGRAPENAGLDEMCEVLAARLEAFERREAAQAAGYPDRDAAEGPAGEGEEKAEAEVPEVPEPEPDADGAGGADWTGAKAAVPEETNAQKMDRLVEEYRNAGWRILSRSGS
jgi:hypothetical protein